MASDADYEAAGAAIAALYAMLIVFAVSFVWFHGLVVKFVVYCFTDHTNDIDKVNELLGEAMSSSSSAAPRESKGGLRASESAIMAVEDDDDAKEEEDNLEKEVDDAVTDGKSKSDSTFEEPAKHVQDSSGSLGAWYRKLNLISKIVSSTISLTFTILFIEEAFRRSEAVRTSLWVGYYLGLYGYLEALFFLFVMAGLVAERRGDVSTGALLLLATSFVQLYSLGTMAALVLEEFSTTDSQTDARDVMRGFSVAIWAMPVFVIASYLFERGTGLAAAQRSRDIQLPGVKTVERSVSQCLGVSTLCLAVVASLGVYSLIVHHKTSNDIQEHIGVNRPDYQTAAEAAADSHWDAWHITWVISKVLSVALAAGRHLVKLVYRSKVKELRECWKRIFQIFYGVALVVNFQQLLSAILEKLSATANAEQKRSLEETKVKMDEEFAKQRENLRSVAEAQMEKLEKLREFVF